MIVVDTSVWIDYFNGVDTPETDWLDNAVNKFPVIMGDLILMEVLQGFRFDKDFKTAKKYLHKFPFMTMGGKEIVLQSASNYRYLRQKGITVRKSIDVLIGTFCIQNNFRLLHCDTDFTPWEIHLKLITVRTR